MKVFISMPPLDQFIVGTPQLSQNRQFQIFKSHSTIYPILLASAATLLKSKGYDVRWDDAITKRESYSDWVKKICREKPNIIVIESKTPVVKMHWSIIKDIKACSPGTKVVLLGDHVTAFPQESLDNGSDFVIGGGDFDILLLNLLEKIEGKTKTKFKSLDELPFVDRELTNWKDYAFSNGNYKFLPGSYTQAARDCFYSKCTFCSWGHLFPLCSYRRRSPKNVVDEIEELVNKHSLREVFDDSGTFPVGDWLKEFCNLMIEKGLNKRVRVSCNMRFGVLKKEDYILMRKAGFRFLLFGLESGNQVTLDLIKKGIKVKDIAEGARWASEAGLNVHLTTMINYSNESKEMAQNTINLAKEIFNRGHADSLQATQIIPYPNTKMYKESLKKNQLAISDKAWELFDMRHRVLKSPLKDEEINEMISQIYKLAFQPKFILRQICKIRCWDDIKYIFRGAKAVLGKHLKDFA